MDTVVKIKERWGSEWICRPDEIVKPLIREKTGGGPGSGALEELQHQIAELSKIVSRLVMKHPASAQEILDVESFQVHQVENDIDYLYGKKELP